MGETARYKPKNRVINPAKLNNLIALTVEVRYYTLNKSLIIKIKKVKNAIDKNKIAI